MSASLDSVDSKVWNFRAQDKRLIVVKTKSESVRKAAVLDVLSNLAFAVEITGELSFDDLKVNGEYLATLKVYTSKNLDGIDKEFYNFFEASDIDQSMEDYIKAYWVYPSKIRFQLESVEEA
jgi:hypothetical protein